MKKIVYGVTVSLFISLFTFSIYAEDVHIPLPEGATLLLKCVSLPDVDEQDSQDTASAIGLIQTGQNSYKLTQFELRYDPYDVRGWVIEDEASLGTFTKCIKSTSDKRVLGCSKLYTNNEGVIKKADMMTTTLITKQFVDVPDAESPKEKAPYEPTSLRIWVDKAGEFHFKNEQCE